jgi:twitching motility protein PilU
MERDQAIKLMQDLLRRVLEKGASDLFITAGFPPAIKIDGEVRPQSERALTAEQSGVLTRAIMNDRQSKEFDSSKECNFAIAPPGIGRFRVNAFIQQGQTGCVIRTINAKIPTLEELELPPVLKDVVISKRGLVLVVGGTGSGKSTTLAAMVGYRNEKTRGHIVTIEDPVEYVHTHKGCVVTHREVGVDTDNWHNALKNTLRQAPDVIYIGEIRDRETMEYGIQFAETGHLVLATLHANSSNQALDRVINFFPDERREQLLMEYPRADFAAADTARIWRWPHCRDGNHAQFATDPGPDLQGRSQQDQGRHGALHTLRDEDLRPGLVRAVRNRADIL